MKAALAAAFAGALFALGLVVGGMTVPANVTGFLDVTGAWNPQLAFVMGGAVGVYALLRRWIRRRPAPLLDDHFHEPSLTAIPRDATRGGGNGPASPAQRGRERPLSIDGRLVGGAAIFGVGWGLSGYCPGPALASLGAGASSTLVFVAAMIGGIALARLVLRRS